ncbi:lipoate--protein ligase family protein [Bifidobacterium cebidarum]|uniref:Ligase n=1 Tax=Bifidobacterium cebidarum TaxID=2650773 RepID=A0A6I1GDH9_9BIFI|nr:lipoate--protein ligase family protein [Bifidobacterium cebidarum]KAB7787372.1 ligase [Bifidobacterium cebidarum]
MRRGEYKTPGGKLVAVNVTLDVDGTVRSCRLDGDFFVNAPDDETAEQYLRAITRALVADQPLRSAIDAYPDCRLIGTDAAAIATAYSRAVCEGDGGAGDTGTESGPIYKGSIADSEMVDAEQLRTAASGGSAQGAAAQERAGDYAERWERLKRNLIVLHDHPRTPAEQMRIDESWAREVAEGKRPPTLRIWEWAGPAVVIGRFQSAPDEVNLDVAQRLGFDVVRRCTGGGAMFIEPGNTITYSLYATLEFVQGVGIEESYKLCDWWLVEALRELGLDVRFAGLNDIASQYGKIGGAAQRRFPVSRTAHGRSANDADGYDREESDSRGGCEAKGRGVEGYGGTALGSVLHHATMAYDIDAAKMGQVLNTSREKLSDKAVKSAQKRVDPLKSQTGLSRESIVDHMLQWLA